MALFCVRHNERRTLKAPRQFRLVRTLVTPMTVRGGGIPRRPLALTPNGRMGPPLRSFAADAHDCIMVRVLGPTGYKVVARLNRAPKAGSPLRHRDRIEREVGATANLDSFCAHRPQRCAGRDEETDFEIKSRTDEGKRCAALANSLTKKAP